jgi:MFS family permease
VKKRFPVALAAILTMLGPGTLYSYSLFAQPLGASFSWSSATTTWGFAIASFCLGLGALAGGVWLGSAPARRVAVTGTLLWAAGNVLTGLGTERFGAPLFYLSYGLIGGFGCGLVTIAALTTVIAWFPKRRGMGGGLVAMGFGIGNVYYDQILEQSGAFRAIRHEAQVFVASQADIISPALVHGLMLIFIVSGVGFAALGLLGASFLQGPPAHFVAENAMPTEARLAQTVGNPQAYLLWLILFLNSVAGIAVISCVIPMLSEMTRLPIAAVAFLYPVVAVFNGVGCFFWGVVSDLAGRRATLVLLFLIQGFAFMLIDGVRAPVLLLAMFSLILLCYGGAFGVMPAFNADFFGLRHFGANYGLNLTAWGTAAIVGPWFAATVRDLTGSYSAILLPLAFISFIALIVPLITDRSVSETPPAQPRPA